MEDLVIKALKSAARVHDALGESGEEVVEKNRFGDTALRADIECEEAVLDVLKQSGLPIRIISEEHGDVAFSDTPEYLGILDGLDGSSVYKKSRGTGRYATMFGVFATNDPIYDDYLVSGVMEHSTKRMYVATKGGGAYVIENGERTAIHTSSRTELGTDASIYIDEYFEINRETFSNKLQDFKPADRDFSSGSSAIHYVDVATGRADLALECTRKNNLEIAVAYALVTEAGGVMMALDGSPLADKKYFQFGQQEMVPVVTAATGALAQHVIEKIST